MFLFFSIGSKNIENFFLSLRFFSILVQILANLLPNIIYIRSVFFYFLQIVFFAIFIFFNNYLKVYKYKNFEGNRIINFYKLIIYKNIKEYKRIDNHICERCMKT